MLTLFIIVLLVLALSGGLAVHPALFLLAVLAVLLLVADRRRVP